MRAVRAVLRTRTRTPRTRTVGAHRCVWLHMYFRFRFRASLHTTVCRVRYTSTLHATYMAPFKPPLIRLLYPLASNPHQPPLPTPAPYQVVEREGGWLRSPKPPPRAPPFLFFSPRGVQRLSLVLSVCANKSLKHTLPSVVHPPFIHSPPWSQPYINKCNNDASVDSHTSSCF